MEEMAIGYREIGGRGDGGRYSGIFHSGRRHGREVKIKQLNMLLKQMFWEDLTG